MNKTIKTLAGALAIGTASLGAVAVHQAQAGADESRAVFQRGGANIASEDFSFNLLRTEADSLAVGDAKHAALQDCMARRGFELPDPGQESSDPRIGDPDFEAAFGLAMIGDDGSSDVEPPALQAVTLPNGDVVSHIGTTVTSGTCTYDVAMAASGLPYLERETLRVEMMVVQAQADRAVIGSDAFQDLKAGSCADKTDDYDLLAQLDDPAAFCGDEDLREALSTVRSDLHHKIASENAKNVQAWIDVLDQERAWAARQ